MRFITVLADTSDGVTGYWNTAQIYLNVLTIEGWPAYERILISGREDWKRRVGGMHC